MPSEVLAGEKSSGVVKVGEGVGGRLKRVCEMSSSCAGGSKLRGFSGFGTLDTVALLLDVEVVGVPGVIEGVVPLRPLLVVTGILKDPSRWAPK